MRTLLVTLLLGLTTVAAAEPAADAPSSKGPRIKLVQRPNRPRPDLKPLPAAALAGHTIYLNRCLGGCQVTPGINNMPSDPTPGDFISQPANLAPASDLSEPEWAGILKCVKEVYSPFNVTVTDERPSSIASYSGIFVAGNNSAKAGAALGLPPGTGGFGGSKFNQCNPDPEGVAFAFADNDNVNIFAFEALGNNSSEARILGLCWIIAQETGHNFGMDHEFEYVDDKASACNDPMTYEADCGGQKFFRNRFAACGVSNGIDGNAPGPRPCFCGPNQNSHLKLLNIFGAGTSLIPPPTTSIITPATSSSAANSLGTAVNGIAGSKRGVGRVELYINGYKWAAVGGAPFGRSGQADPSNYQLIVPADVPDSIVDVQLKAYDDLELVSESQIVTVVKGAAGGCQTADTCATGQRCEAGKCFWDPPVGEIGEDCTFPQFCVSGLCSNSVFQGDGICTQSCVVGLADACPTGLTCVDAGSDAVCIVVEDTGCCSTSNQGTPWAPFMLGGIVLGFIVIRRKK